jgi:hypothetical protein
LPESGVAFEKEELAPQIRALFERIRVAYLSAKDDPRNYKNKWMDEVATLRDIWDEKSKLSAVLPDVLDEKTLFGNGARNPESSESSKIYEGIVDLRYGHIAKDPFSKKFGEGVLGALMDNEEYMQYFIHWALRSDKKALEEDRITDGYAGLDMEYDDIADFITEHYGDEKDTKRVSAKVNAAKDALKEAIGDESWKDLARFDIQKAEVHFLVPNKPMYRIFDIEDMEELKGFSGQYIVQEKYDGMRIQIHKIDNKVKIYSYNEKDITEKCPEQVKIMENKHFGECILDAELLLFNGEEPLQRAEVVAKIFKDKESDTELRAHVFDIMRHEEKNMVESPLSERIKTLFQNYAQHSHEKLQFPTKKDTREADSLKEIAEYAKDIMQIPTAEGVVIKDITSTYYIGTRKNPKWIKWKKFVDLDLIVLEKKSTKSNMFSYTLGAGPLSAEEARKTKSEKIEDKYYMNVGKALNTNIDVDVGSIVRVKVDEVNKRGDRYSVYSAKVIEIPEVEYPDKVITLELLSANNKKSIKYKVKALEKGINITDNIHGDAMILAKGDMDGFTIFGFDAYNLMAKNALVNLDEWKSEIENIHKMKKGLIRTHIKNFIHKHGPTSIEEIEKHILRGSDEIKKLYNEIFDGDIRKLKKYCIKQIAEEPGEPIWYYNQKTDKFSKSDILHKYETPKNLRSGQFKLYARKDENLNLAILLEDKTMIWNIRINSIDDVFNLFGKSKKFPAQVEENMDKTKLIDEGDITLGVQRHGYHEYFLEGNKFESKLHFRVVPMEGEEYWVAFTSVKQKPVEEETDDGVWDIYADKNKKLTFEGLKEQ